MMGSYESCRVQRQPWRGQTILRKGWERRREGEGRRDSVTVTTQ